MPLRGSANIQTSDSIEVSRFQQIASNLLAEPQKRHSAGEAGKLAKKAGWKTKQTKDEIEQNPRSKQVGTTA
jgi:hypothetical protein